MILKSSSLHVLRPQSQDAPSVLLCTELPRSGTSRSSVINLRQVNSPTTNSSADQHASRFSAPNFRGLTMDDVVSNLDELLEFVSYCVLDELDVQDVGAAANASADTRGVSTERRDGDATGTISAARG